MLDPVRTRSLALLAVAALVIVACGTQDPGVEATRSRQDSGGGLIPDETTTTPAPGSTEPGDTDPPPTEPSPEPTTPPTFPIEAGIIDFGSTKTAREYDGYLIAAFKDIQEFWSAEFPAVYGSPFEPLSGGIYAAYSDRQEPIPGCGTAETTYADVEGNAFYCILGDFMAYDDEFLLPDLVEQLGASAVAVVLAHEFGHAVTGRAGNWENAVVLKEQQADCFAGAWAAHAASEESTFPFSDNDVRRGLVAMIEVRDPVEIGGANDPNAHGTGFDRVGAYQDGFIGGAAACVPFFEQGRDLVDIAFDFEDPNAGDLPLRDATGEGNDIITLLPDDLDRFWVERLATESITFTPPTLVLYPQAGPFPPCEGVAEDAYVETVFYCAATNEILMDEDYALQLGQDPETKVGDVAVGFLLGQAYGQAVQSARGSTLAGEPRVLLNDCLTGAWVADIVPPLPEGRLLSLSAGDLDEAVITAIATGDETAADDVNGSAFEKIDSFRVGVLDGLDACLARYPG